jgi:hypothetical protein
MALSFSGWRGRFICNQLGNTRQHSASAQHPLKMIPLLKAKRRSGLMLSLKNALHTPVQEVVNKLGLQGTFRTPGSGNTAIVGSPDFSWIIDALNIPHPILVVSSLFTICIC